jgi:hypothetical protein
MPIFIPPIAPHSPSSVIWGWYNRPVVATVPSGLSIILLRIKKNLNPWMSRRNFLYHLLNIKITLHFAHPVTLYVSYDSMNSECFVEEHEMVGVCNGTLRVFYEVGTEFLNFCVYFRLLKDKLRRFSCYRDYVEHYHLGYDAV